VHSSSPIGVVAHHVLSFFELRFTFELMVENE